MLEPDAGNTGAGRTPLLWCAGIVPVAAVLSAAETVLCALALPAAVSSPFTLLLCWLYIASVFVWFSLPLVAIMALAEAFLRRGGRHLRLPPTAVLLSVASSTVVVSVLADRLLDAVAQSAPEFYASAFRTLAIFAAFGAGLVLHELLQAPLARLLLSRIPFLDSRRPAAALLLLVMAGVALWIGHAVLAPVHQVPLIRISANGMLTAALIASRLLAPQTRSPRRRAAFAVTVLVFMSCWPLTLKASRAVPFVVFAHAPNAAALGSLLVRLADTDGDGSMPTWLGGSDCAEGDASRGPLALELPADGIDQDCRGGDNVPPVPPTPAAPWPDCTPPKDKPSVLFLTVDALRADAISEPTTPNLMHLAGQATHFTRAYPPSSMTTPTFLSVFSGQALSDLSERNLLTDTSVHVERTLAERYAEAGYHTVGFNYFYIHPATGRGFVEQNPFPLDHQPAGAKHQLMATSISNGIIASLEAQRDAPLFLWAHYPDLHAPYTLIAESRTDPMSSIKGYLDAATYVDRQIGRVLGHLAQSGQLSKTIVIVSADHGEQLGERWREGHGPYLFEEGIRVPLLMHVPGCPARTVNHPVNLGHVGASLSPFTGVDVSGYSWFAPLPLPVVVEDSGQNWVGLKRAVVWGHHKLLLDVQNGGAMLFDLKADPGELVDLYDADSPLTQDVEAAYQRWLDAPGAR